MASDYTPTNVTSGFSMEVTINQNFNEIKTAMDKLLNREEPADNALLQVLDFNGNQAINLPGPTLPTEPLRLQDINLFTNNGTGGTSLITLSGVPVGDTDYGIGFKQVRDNPTTFQAIIDLDDSTVQFGVIGDGVADDRLALFNADVAGPVILTGTHLINSDLIFTNHVTFLPGSIIVIGASATVTINGIEAPKHQRVFNQDSGGLLLLKERFGFATWWGAVDDAVTDSGVFGNQAIAALGRTGVLIYPVGDINTHYHFDVGLVVDQDEFTIRGEQFRARLGADSDIVVISQPDRMPEAFFGLHLKNLDCFNNVVTGTSPVVSLNRSFLFILDNLYIDKGPSHGVNFNSICAQGVIQNCVAEECQGSGFNQSSATVTLMFTNCLSFANGISGFASGSSSTSYGNSIIGSTAFGNAQHGFSRGDGGVSLVGCTARNNGANGFSFTASAINASVKGCVAIDDQGSPTQLFGFEKNHFSQDLDSPLGFGNVTALINNNEALAQEVIAAGIVTIPALPQHAILRLDTEASAATDDVDQINGGYNGQIVIFRSSDDARDVTLKDGTFNLALAGDFTLDRSVDRITLQFDKQVNRWCELSRSDNQPN